MSDITANITSEDVTVNVGSNGFEISITETPISVQISGGAGPAGPEGPTGPAGPEGPAGPAGASQNTAVHNQIAASATWTINHSWPGGFPSVTVVDSSGKTVVGDITYVNDTQLTIQFSAPFSGKAYLN